MRWKLYRLLAPVDAATGGAGATGTNTTDQQQQSGAQGANGQQSSKPTLDRNSDEAKAYEREVQDSLFAKLRREGRLKDPKKDDDTTTSSKTRKKNDDGDNAGGGLTAEDVLKMNRRQRDFDRAIGRANLSDRSMSRAEQAFELDGPEDVAGWVKSYLEDIGHASTSQQAGTSGQQGTSTVTNNQKSSSNDGRPVSDGGGTAKTTQTDDVSLLDMSDADRAEWIRRNGLPKYYARLRQDAKGRRVLLRKPG